MNRARNIHDGAQQFLAIKPPADDAKWLHECEDGHCWQEHPNGTVSPSYGYGGTELAWPGYDSKTCPEPQRGRSRYVDDEGNEVGPNHGIECPSCGGVFYCGNCDGPEGTTLAERLSGGVCDPPKPVCLKPIAWSAPWTPVKRLLHREGKGGIGERYEGWTHTWVPVDLETGFSKAENVREPTLF